MAATSATIPYPCWLPAASAVRIRNVASCIGRLVMPAVYIAELTIPPRVRLGADSTLDMSDRSDANGGHGVVLPNETVITWQAPALKFGIGAAAEVGYG